MPFKIARSGHTEYNAAMYVLSSNLGFTFCKLEMDILEAPILDWSDDGFCWNIVSYFRQLPEANTSEMF